ncbi:MAG: Rne/Rng family ribonuclease [Bifidobacterium psychraerophilum]|uniref:Rne/Rng family ribonuclease n=1 Tax=Bifidobacterium psychraerophilum TaxID=218140 RepID=UPI0039ECAD66
MQRAARSIVPIEQNSGSSKAGAQQQSSTSNDSLNSNDVNESSSLGQIGETPRRRRSGRRVVRVAGAAGADLPVKIEVKAASAKDPEHGDVTRDAPGRGGSPAQHEEAPARSRRRRAPRATDDLEFEEPKATDETERQGRRSSRSRSAGSRSALSDTAGSDSPRSARTGSDHGAAEHTGSNRTNSHAADSKRERDERAARAVDSIRFLQVDTNHSNASSSAKSDTGKPVRGRAMTSLLFQEPVLPLGDASREDADDVKSDEGDEPRHTSNRRGKGQQRRQDSGLQREKRGSRDTGAASEFRDYDSGDNGEEEHSERSRRSRRLNAQERRAAAEVGQIEEDLEYDEIPYTPIDEEAHAAKGSRRSRSRSSDSEDSPRRRDRGGETQHDAEHEHGAESDRGEGQPETRRRRTVSRDHDEDEGESTVTRRRRRRRGSAKALDEESSELSGGSKRSRKQQYIDEITNIEGSTRLEAKKQRRRDNRRDRSRQTQLIEQDFLARREDVDRVMVVREKERHTQISVLEDDILVEHYVSDIQEVATVGNIYLGRVQNVLPSMEAAFVDIGQARNGVLYAGEVNWDAARLEGQPRRIELAFRSGDPVLVQVTKDPIGHKGARLTSQVTLAGRFLVLVPSGGMTGVSRKLSEHERSRLKGIVTKIAPKDMGVIIRTAADHASEEAITKDLQTLIKQWESVEKKRDSAKHHKKPKLLKGEPDVAIRVVRDIFNDDFNELIVEGDKVYERISEYLDSMAPDLREKLSKWDPADHEGNDVFDRWQIDGQLRKGMERQVYLPSGGSLVIDRTEAMTTIDVNTGRFIGKGKSLEETVTRCNLEASEEIARQLRLRDIGGMLMIDYVDMVMQANRDLVLRRLVECLARDRTKHQVAEVTSLGLVQMTRKRVGQGLVEAFSEECPTCKGRGFILHDEPTVSASYDDPYAVKGGDPFVKSTVKHHTPAKESAPSSSKGSSPDVKAKLAKIAAAAQSASEEAD